MELSWHGNGIYPHNNDSPMKHLLLALLLLPLGLMAQTFPVDSTTQKIVYSEVVQAANTSAADLYSRAREWFATTFNSADAVLEMDDKAAGKLVGNAFSDIHGMSATMMTKMKLWYAITVELKDGRYRYTINHLQFQNYYNPAHPLKLSAEAQTQKIPGENFLLAGNMTKKGKENKPLIEGKKQAEAKMTALIQSLKTSMLPKKDW